MIDNGVGIYQKLQHKTAKAYHDDDSQRIIQSKLKLYVWRLVLIIEVIEQTVFNSFTKTLSDKRINKAIKLVEYFRANAFKMYQKISPTSPLYVLPKNKMDLYKALPKKFKREDILTFAENYKLRFTTKIKDFKLDHIRSLLC